MSRSPRSHLPGAIFHLTTRTQGHEPRFAETIRSRIVAYAAEAVRRSDATLLAYAIMPNHLHLVIRQGDDPLGRVMQPFLQRIAVLVQRRYGVEGHVFERRFRDRPCLDPEHARNAIVYTHLNPVRSGLVAAPEGYRWSSHGAYVGQPAALPMAGILAVGDGLRLFARHEARRVRLLRRDYRAFLDWRVERDRRIEEAEDDTVSLRPPPVSGGDRCWSRSYAPAFRSTRLRVVDDSIGDRRPGDLHDLARAVLAAQYPPVDGERVRSAYKGRREAGVRRDLVKRLSRSGHSGTAIARYLRVSPQCVSNILSAARNTS